MDKKTFKVYYGESDIRRFTLAPVTWDNFLKQLTIPPGQKVVYVDEDNDRCTLSTEREFEAMLEQFNFESVIKIHMSDKSSNSKNVPESPQEGAGVGKCRIVVPGFVGLANTVPSCVSPYVSVTKTSTDTNIDVDYSALIQDLQVQAAKTPQELKKAQEYINSLFEPAKIEAMRQNLKEKAEYVGAALESFLLELQRQFEENKKQIIQQKAQQEKAEQKNEEPKVEVKEVPKVEVKEVPKVEVKEVPKPLKEEPCVKEEIKEEPKENLKRLRFAEVEKPYQYAAQLKELMLMGFPEAKAKEALDIFNGDTEFAIDELLNSEFHHL